VELPTSNRVIGTLSAFTTTDYQQKRQTESIVVKTTLREDSDYRHFHSHDRQHRDHQGFCQRGQGDRNLSSSLSSSGNNINHHHHPIFLWGIPSTMDPKEVDRRRIIRSTYLDYYVQLQEYLVHSSRNSNSSNDTSLLVTRRNRTTKTTTTTTLPPVVITNRVCSLQDWTCRYEELRSTCQIIYVFFIGGNSEAPPELLDESFTDFRQMLAPASPGLQPQHQHFGNSRKPSESTPPSLDPSPSSSSSSSLDRQQHRTNALGELYLNIRENQFDGKMTTWFQLAALIGKEFPEIDYVAKVDSDLLLFTPTFLKYIGEEHRIVAIGNSELKHVTTTGGNANLLRTRGVYGGVEFPATKCIIPNRTAGVDDGHECPLKLVGRSYMSGEMNFLSMDLAQYIVSDECPRKQLTLPHEDVSLSNYVYSYINNTQYHKRERSMTSFGGNSVGRFDDTVPVTIEVISLNKSMILRTKDKSADGSDVNFRSHPEKLEDYIFGHSSNPGPQPHLLWKSIDDFAGMWKVFMYYHALSLKGPDGYTYLDILNNRTRKIRYPGEWPGLKLDRIANAMLRGKEGKDEIKPLQLPEATPRRIEWSIN
jgi:hypothetical protein